VPNTGMPNKLKVRVMVRVRHFGCLPLSAFRPLPVSRRRWGVLSLIRGCVGEADNDRRPSRDGHLIVASDQYLRPMTDKHDVVTSTLAPVISAAQLSLTLTLRKTSRRRRHGRPSMSCLSFLLVASIDTFDDAGACPLRTSTDEISSIYANCAIS